MVTAAGLADSSGMLVVLAPSMDQAMETLWALPHEPADPFHRLAHELRARLLSVAGRQAELYDEISRLNNELVNMQRELAKKTVALERLNQEKNRFLGMAAHDLRGPLIAIMGYAEFLLEAIDSPRPEHRVYLETILSSSSLMARLIDDLLDVAQIESGELRLHREPSDIGALVERCLALIRPMAAAKRVRIVVCGDTLPPLLLDRDKMTQVLNNLLGNAVKFSPEGSTVTVRLRRGEKAEIAVEDQGPGIPPQEVSNLFTPFHQGSARATKGERGRGLGLWIARRMVEGHGGTLDVVSGPTGSTFIASLPMVLTSTEERT